MIINWKKPKAGLKVIPLLNEQHRIVKNVIFIPGHNNINDEDWAAARRHPDILEAIEKGWFEEIGKKVVKEVEVTKEVTAENGKTTKQTVKEKQTVVESASIKDLPAKEAISIIEDTFDVKALEAWKDEEGRDEVRAKISKQLEFIEKGGK